MSDAIKRATGASGDASTPGSPTKPPKSLTEGGGGFSLDPVRGAGTELLNRVASATSQASQIAKDALPATAAAARSLVDDASTKGANLVKHAAASMQKAATSEPAQAFVRGATAAGTQAVKQTVAAATEATSRRVVRARNGMVLLIFGTAFALGLGYATPGAIASLWKARGAPEAANPSEQRDRQ